MTVASEMLLDGSQRRMLASVAESALAWDAVIAGSPAKVW